MNSLRKAVLGMATVLALASCAAASATKPTPKISCFLGLVLAHDPNLNVYAIRPEKDSPEIRSDSAKVPHIPQVLVCSDFSEPMTEPTPGVAPKDGTTVAPT